ncbi:hypothetical protein CMO96_01840 [Candidatus Woesebacteria bacterium]|nr:hypothetical protein [Candidatus Woesebacteria bacterium]
MTSSPNKVAGVLVKCRDKVLLLKRSINGAELQGYWSVPCGTVEKGENMWAGAARELYEETFITTKYELQYINHFKIKNNRQFYCYLYSVSKEVKPDIISAPDGYEHNEWGYFPISSLPEPIDPKLKKAIFIAEKM